MLLARGVVTGSRRRKAHKLNLFFALFALAYAGTLLLGVAWRQADSVGDYVSINRWNGLFLPVAFTSLLWYVATYTRVRPKWLLYGLTVFYAAIGIAFQFADPCIRPNRPACITPPRVRSQRVSLPNLTIRAPKSATLPPC